MAKTAANAPTELQPNMFEHTVRVYIKKVYGQREDSKEEDQLNLHVAMRLIDGKDFDKVLFTLFGQKGASEYIESGAHAVKAITFDRKYKDHQATFKDGASKIVTLPDITLNKFKIDIADMGMTFELHANKIKGGSAIGDLSEYLNRVVGLDLKRAAHWSNNIEDQQKDLPIDAPKADPKTKAKVAKAKEVANKKNTDKVRSRAPAKSDVAKINAKLKAKAKAKAKSKTAAA